MKERALVIAIDGPAASGKSTTGRLVAERLGYLYVDTGAMYRAVTLDILRRGIDPVARELVEGTASACEIDLVAKTDGLHIFLNGEDVTGSIRRPEVTSAVSLVSSYQGVRKSLVRKQRDAARRGGVVLEGRDIGTVVLPDADLKIFMIADLDARTARRERELRSQGVTVSAADMKEQIRRRDEIDSTRDESPLSRAEDAIELDTSSLTIQEQVDYVVMKAREIIGKRNS